MARVEISELLKPLVADSQRVLEALFRFPAEAGLINYILSKYPDLSPPVQALTAEFVANIAWLIEDGGVITRENLVAPTGTYTFLQSIYMEDTFRHRHRAPATFLSEGVIIKINPSITDKGHVDYSKMHLMIHKSQPGIGVVIFSAEVTKTDEVLLLRAALNSTAIAGRMKTPEPNLEEMLKIVKGLPDE